MAEAAQQQGFSDPYVDRPRTARQMSAERTIRGGETPREAPSRERKSARSGKREVRSSGGGSNTPRRPRNAKAGSGARLLAPLAIVVFAMASFMVMTAGDNETGPQSEERTSSTSESESSNGTVTKTTTTRTTYTVKPGDSFAAIAEKLSIDVDVLSELNPDVDPRALQPGQKLKLK